jgi:acyl-coenzyme A synthetase/AMP-(fatty) acid ligase
MKMFDRSNSKILTRFAFHGFSKSEEMSLADLAGGLSYGSLIQFSAKIARKLKDSGVRPGEIVASKLPPKWDLALSLALMQVGAIGFSANHGEELPSDLGDCWLVGRVKGLDQDKVINFLPREISELQGLQDGQFYLEGPDYEDRPMRIFSSTSAHGSRLIALSEGQLLARSEANRTFLGDTGNVITLEPLSTVDGFVTALGCILQGQMIVFAESSSDLRSLADQWLPSTLVGPTGSLAAFAKRVKQGEEIPIEFQSVRLTGDRRSSLLAGALKKDLGVTTVSVLSTPETGPVFAKVTGEVDSQIVAGLALPGCEGRVRSDSGASLPPLEIGQLALSTPYMASGYWVDGVLAQFSETDFFQTDLAGSLNHSGVLATFEKNESRVLLGGTIVDLESIDNVISSLPGVQDGAALIAEDDCGGRIMAAAVKVDNDFDQKTASVEIREKLGPLTPVAFLLVPEIDRTEAGEVNRVGIVNRYSNSLIEKAYS